MVGLYLFRRSWARRCWAAQELGSAQMGSARLRNCWGWLPEAIECRSQVYPMNMPHTPIPTTRRAPW